MLAHLLSVQGKGQNFATPQKENHRYLVYVRLSCASLAVQLQVTVRVLN
jgi:hypothetical protein